MNLTAEQIQENWDVLMGFIKTYISSPRKEKLLEFNAINKNDKKALRQFVVDNFPDLDKTIMEEIVKYAKGERN